jgi:hypothetical protein
VIHVQALLDGFFLVVVALDQRFAGDVVLALDLGRVELDVVAAARTGCTRRPLMRSTMALSGTSISST